MQLFNIYNIIICILLSIASYILYTSHTIHTTPSHTTILNKDIPTNKPLGFSNYHTVERNELLGISDLRFDLTQTVDTKMPINFKRENTTTVETIKWTKEYSINKVTSLNKPHVFVSSPSTTWRALKWDLWDLSQKWPLLANVLVNEDDSLFILQQGATEDGFVTPDDSIHLPDVVYEIQFTEFLYNIVNPKLYMLYSTNYRVMESVLKLAHDTSWRSFIVDEDAFELTMKVEDDKSNDAPSDRVKLKQPAPSMSIAHPGVVLQASYKEHHRVRVQLRGRSRYVLFPPSRHLSLYLYPAIHAFHRHSQVDMGSGGDNEEDDFPRFRSVSGVAVDLYPGQALYIPPYWLVRSEFTTLSMFLDVNSISKEQIHLAEAQFTGVPIGKAATKDERIVAAQAYAVHFLSRLRGLKSPLQYSKAHYQSRYALLYPVDSVHMMKMASKFTCFADNETYHASLISGLDKKGIVASAEAAAELLNDESLSTGVRWIWVGDYIDRISRWAMGDPNEAVFFILSCLRFDSKIPIVKEEPGPNVMKIS